ncbi:MAG: radical SAM protein [Phycisphaeraceae bacterium]|nr:radical SAM protein [Phycisphaeraceae bacterium]
MGLLGRVIARSTVHIWRQEIRWLHRLGFVKPPVAVQWISTSACDLTCPHCYSHAGRRSQGELTTDEAMRLVIDPLTDLGRPLLVLAGGEPTLRPDFGRLIAHARKRGIGWSMHTHGGHIARVFNDIAAAPPEMVAVSLDGPPRQHDDFRGRAGSFDRALEAVAMLKTLPGVEVVIGTSLHRDNADLLADMLPIVMESGADSWGLHLVTPEGRASEHGRLLATPGQLRRAAVFARQFRSLFRIELDNEWGSAGEDDCFYREGRFFCGAGRIACVVAADGCVMPCTTTDSAESAGNVRDTPLSRIWAQGFAAFRSGEDALRSDVHDCWLQTRHGHTCRRAAFDWDQPLDPWADSGTRTISRSIPLTVGASS